MAMVFSKTQRAEGCAVVEQWDFYDLALRGRTAGNPFVDVQLTARFTQCDRTIEADGFYDGEGTYRIRFMPDATGTWNYKTESNDPELSGKSGTFQCVPPTGNNHGPVRVAHT